MHEHSHDKFDEEHGFCPDCQAPGRPTSVARRDFLKGVLGTATAAATTSLPVWATSRAQAAPTPSSPAETAVKALYETLTDPQRKEICFDWNYTRGRYGLLRTHVANFWHITDPKINSDFYTPKQKMLIHDIFKGIVNPDWYSRFMQQLDDDAQGFGQQSIAIFGKPGEGKFEFVLTGRHITVRADGNSEDHVAFGGPIFYGHGVGKRDNVFREQAELANNVYQMLDEKQRRQAVLIQAPKASQVAFQGPQGQLPGIPVAELDDSQKQQLQKVLLALVEPYRKDDQEEALAALEKQGGLDRCSLVFYWRSAFGLAPKNLPTVEEAIRDYKFWDNWRLEGPSFVWNYRGTPHLHTYVNVASDPSVELNAAGY